jgi:hypothetical protein
VGFECGVLCNLWQGSIEMQGTDLSNEGLWLETPYPLELGDELVVTFSPPGARPGQEIWATAEVARVGLWRRRTDPWPVGMGLSFTYCSFSDQRFLARLLLHRPPRLPRRSAPPPLPPSGRAFSGPDRRCTRLSLGDLFVQG